LQKLLWRHSVSLGGTPRAASVLILPSVDLRDVYRKITRAEGAGSENLGFAAPSARTRRLDARSRGGSATLNPSALLIFL
jgi:hypothetical protein